MLIYNYFFLSFEYLIINRYDVNITSPSFNIPSFTTIFTFDNIINTFSEPIGYSINRVLVFSIYILLFLCDFIIDDVAVDVVDCSNPSSGCFILISFIIKLKSLCLQSINTLFICVLYL
eukprot:712852_1